jgi:excisionase family DNA binding protein
MEMGSPKFLTKKQAAQYLGVGVRMIFKYIEKGYLRTEKRGKHVGVFEDEVESLKKERIEPSPIPLTARTIALLHIEVKTLRMQVNTLMRLMDVKYEPLELTAPEYQTLYRMADQYWREGWSPHVEEMWADTLVRMKIPDLEKISEVSGDEHPWRPFLNFAKALHMRPYNEGLRDMFAAARNNLEHLTILWGQIKGCPVEEMHLMIKREATPSKRHLISVGRPSENH